MVEGESSAAVYVEINGQAHEVCRGKPQAVKLCLNILGDFIQSRRIDLEIELDSDNVDHDDVFIDMMCKELLSF